VIVIAAPTRNPEHEQLLHRVHRRYPQLPLLLVTADNHPSLARRAMAHGVHAYVHSESDPGEIQLALQSAAAGEFHFPEDVLEDLPGPDTPPRTVPDDIHERLTKLTRRERQVMELLGRGYANREIAERLDLREGTVRIYVHRVIRQLGLRNRVDVALCANYVAAAQ